MAFTNCYKAPVDISAYQLSMLGTAFDYIKNSFEDDKVAQSVETEESEGAEL